MELIRNKSETIICTAGCSYFLIYPNGDIYRCMESYNNKRPPLMNCIDFSKELLFEKLGDRFCIEKECKAGCDRDWSIKWKKSDDRFKKIGESEIIESAWGKQDPNNIFSNNLHIVWNPTLVCNFNCEYCSCCSDRSKIEKYHPSSFEEISTEQWLDFFRKIEKSYPGNIRITTSGGEPFIRRDTLMSVINEFQGRFEFSITTNASMSIVEFGRSIKPVGINFNLSLHPSSKVFHFEDFLGKAAYLKNKGFNVRVNFVSYPQQMYLIDRYRDIFGSIDVPIDFMPWIGGDRGGVICGHTEDEIEFINSRVSISSRMAENNLSSDFYEQDFSEIIEQEVFEDNEQESMIGAFYYPWYEKKTSWEEMCYRYKQYDITPKMGFYDSSDRYTVQSHILEAKKYGLDFFAISYNGLKHIERFNDVINFCNDEDFKFAVHFETNNIFREYFTMNDEDIDELKEHIRFLSNKVLLKDNYLKIDGKPVLFIYVSRVILGDLNEIKIIRDVIRQETGMECIIAGDEIWWPEKDWIGSKDRIKNFDYIYTYCPHTLLHGNDKFIGNQYIDFVEDLYKDFYDKAKITNVGLIPSIMPRLNDSAVRETLGGYFIPPDGTDFFEKYFDMCKKYFLGDRKILLITSFNEWYEDTQIESTGDSYNGLTDDYDQNPNYRDMYLSKIVDFKKEMESGEFFREGTWDETIFNSIPEEYEIYKDGFEGKTVVDVGGHVGGFSSYCLKNGANKVWYFEVDNENFRIASNILKKHENVTLFNRAVWRSDVDECELFFSGYDKNTGGGNVFFNDGHSNPVVEFISLDDIISEFGIIDVLKMDCEFSEFPILLTCTMLDHVKCIVGEFHETGGIYSKHKIIPEFAAVHGYEQYTMEVLKVFLENNDFDVEFKRNEGDKNLGLFIATNRNGEKRDISGGEDMGKLVKERGSLLEVIQQKAQMKDGEKFSKNIVFKFKEYKRQDVGTIFYFMDKEKDPVIALIKRKRKLKITYHDGSGWRIIHTGIKCDEDFTVEIKGQAMNDVFINSQRFTAMEGVLDISRVYGKVCIFMVHNEKYPDPEPPISKMEKFIEE